MLSITNKIVLAFVTLIIGVVLIGSIATQSLAVTETTAASETKALTIDNDIDINETEVYTVTNNPTGWKVTDCPLTNLVISNQSGTALTVTTDYIPTLSAGTYTMVNNSDTIELIGAYNNTYVTYSYCGDDYMNLTWGRTIINLLAGFFALAILGLSVGLFYSVGKDTGII